MSVRFFCLFPVALFLPSVAQADEGFKLSGSVRLRYEAIDGQARAGFDSEDALVNARTQILAEYRLPGVRLAAELYDSRAYGADAGTPLSTGEVNALELVQAYVATDIGDLAGTGLKATVTAGRMALNLGSRRLVAADDYRNTTSGYTGVRADVAGRKGWKASLIYVLPQVRLPDDAASLRDNKVKPDTESFDAVLWGGLVSKADVAGRAMGELSYFHFGERDAPGRPTRDRSLNSFGGRIIAEPKMRAIDYEVEAIYQMGEISRSIAPGAATQEVGAGFIHADIGYSFAGSWKPHVTVEWDWASGDRPGGRYGRFDSLFGMRRADLAPAGLYNAIGRTNIATAGARIEVTPGKRLDGFVSYRGMWLAAREDSFSTTGVRDAAGQSGNFAGQQVDTRVRYWLLPKALRLEFDGVLLFKGRFLRDAPNAPGPRNTRYISFNATIFF